MRVHFACTCHIHTWRGVTWPTSPSTVAALGIAAASSKEGGGGSPPAPPGGGLVGGGGGGGAPENDRFCWRERMSREAGVDEVGGGGGGDRATGDAGLASRPLISLCETSSRVPGVVKGRMCVEARSGAIGVQQ